MYFAFNRNIDAVIIHSTFNNSGGNYYDVDKVLAQFKRYKVSAHYVMDRNGVVYRLVDEKDVAYHAGRCQFPDGGTNGNSRSIGIEVMTSFDEAPTEIQMEKLVLLVNWIKEREKIQYVLRHSDIAPERKTDPWNFDWADFKNRLKNGKETTTYVSFEP